MDVKNGHPVRYLRLVGNFAKARNEQLRSWGLEIPDQYEDFVKSFSKNAS